MNDDMLRLQQYHNALHCVREAIDQLGQAARAIRGYDPEAAKALRGFRDALGAEECLVRGQYIRLRDRIGKDAGNRGVIRSVAERAPGEAPY